MQNNYCEQDVSESIRKGLWASIACTVLVVTLVILSPTDIPDDYLGAPQQPWAHREAPAAPQASPPAEQGANWYHDAPFVTSSGSVPDPMPQ